MLHKRVEMALLEGCEARGVGCESGERRRDSGCELVWQHVEKVYAAMKKVYGSVWRKGAAAMGKVYGSGGERDTAAMVNGSGGKP